METFLLTDTKAYFAGMIIYEYFHTIVHVYEGENKVPKPYIKSKVATMNKVGLI